ncbi:hypothetical protein [Paractinoplanes lichenicola]|uniref:Uncharacterized protein n=1 Tax=Paractinoplanes lichenicola TaxID=2802976 RepID=A0ABS1VU80_9ACTN|nr:hypothetical protein [Actinoplanes lichenicola]MBL7258010.1 hypothetical protein [Actinoplanes lichenicola]
MRGARAPGLVAKLVERPPALPRGMSLRGSPERGILWIDTGPVWLLDPGVRQRLTRNLAEATTLLADALARRLGELVPNAWLPAADGPGWLCADLHAVEVANDTQRELCANQFRRFVPELIALTGRAAFGPGHVEASGSRRLAEATDHVPARYLDSASQAHLGRMRESLRRDHGIARLEHMDVNPLGGPAYPFPAVELRCIDGQLLPRTAVAHALLVQAIAMAARRLEQEGRRVPPIPDRVLDRDRSRAIATGIAARLENDLKNRPPAATMRLVELIDTLVPELAAMQVEPAELATLTGGLSILDAHPRAVCGENDLWRAEPLGDRLGRRLTDPKWLATDHLAAVNQQLAPGATAMATRFWEDRLAAQRTPRRRAGRSSAGRAARDLFEQLGGEPAEPVVLAAIERYLAAGGPIRLHDELRRTGADAKQLRRSLRPAAEARRTLSRVPDDWARGAAAAAVQLARTGGRALVSLRLPQAERETATKALMPVLADPPAGVRLLVINDSLFQDKVNIEILAVRRGGAR